MAKVKNEFKTSKLDKPMKIIWRQYREIIRNNFEDKLIKIVNKQIESFDLFIPMQPYYSIWLMSRIRKLLFKVVNGIGKLDIKPYIRPSEDEKLGILIRYKM